MTYNKLFPRLLLALLVIISVSARTDAQYCELDYIYPSSFNFPSAGGSEEIEIGIMGMCTVTYSNVPAWINVYCSGGAGSIVCSSNTGAARNARIYVRLNGQARGFFDVSQAEGYPPLIAGTISTNKTFVCYGTSPGTFSSTSAASGGNCSGAYSYQWQYSTNGSTYYNISGETSLTYTPGNLTSTRYYRRRVTCSGATEYSNRLTITVNSLINGGRINGNQEICEDGYAGIIANQSSPSGGTGYLRYEWESSYDNLTWNTAQTQDPWELYLYPPQQHTQTTYYRRVAIDSRNCRGYSNTATVSVKEKSVRATSISDSRNNICPGGLVRLTVVGGSLGEDASWKWYSGSCGGTPAGTGPYIDVYPNTTTTYYVRADGECNTTDCVSKTINVYTYSTDPTSITAVSCAESGESVSLTVNGGSLSNSGGARWKWYKNSTSGTPFASTTGRTVNVNHTATTTYYVRAEGGCGPTTGSVSKTINIESEAPTSITSTAGDIICPNTATTLEVVGGSLGTGASWKWYIGSTSGSSVHTGATYPVSPGSATTYYVRAEGTCGPSGAVSKTINVYTYSTDPTSITAVSCAESGESVSLTVNGGSLSNSGGARWKWYKNSTSGTPFASTTGRTVNVNHTAATTYYVRAEGGCGPTTGSVSKTINIESEAPTSITSTAGDIICPNTATTLEVVGGSLGTGASWKWYIGSTSGSSVHTGPTYPVSPGSATTYYVRAEGTCGPSGAVSKTITTKQPPSIQTQPYNQKVIPGNQANFTVSESGISYQWQESFTAYGPWDNIPSSDSPTLNYTTSVSDSSLIFVRCLVNGDCSFQTASDTVSVSFELPPYIVDESGGIHINSKGELEAHVFASHEFDWTDGSLFDFGGPGSAEWDDEMHAWKCTGYVTMYLKSSNDIAIHNRRSYKMSVDVYRENDQDKAFYWGGIRLTYTKSVLSGFGGAYDYSATRGSVRPETGQWVTYTSNPKVGIQNTYEGWGDDGCAYYRVGGLINYNGENTQVTYVRDIRFYESSDEYSYQWKKNDISIPGETKPVLNITRSEIDLTIGDTLSCEVDGMASYFLSPSYASHNFNKYLNPDTDENYIHTVIPQIEITDEDIFDRNTDCIINQVSYFDGLGRPLQNISVSASPSVMDIIQPVVYDDYGREAILYLSYESYTDNLGAYQSTAIGSTYGAGSKQYDFYNDAENDVTDDPNPFAETVFEASPLSRVLEQGSPGASWQPENVSIPGSGHTVKYDWGANQENDVLKFYISGDDLALDLPEDKYYDEGELYKTVTKNENWTSGNINTTEEYRDKQGQVILKRTYVGPTPEKVETYYVYDIYGLLRYVITPAAAYEIVKTGSTVTFPLDKDDNIIKNLCYYYRYDARKRMIEKQLPGSEPVYMVYDKRDRLVLTQDGNLREDINHNDLKKWMFTKYDHLNRPVITGILTADHVYSQPVMQDTVDNAYDGTSLLYYVEKDIGEIITLGYTDTSFPHSGNTFIYNSEIEYLTATYYDDYNFPDTISFDTDNGISGYSDDEGNVNYFDNALGLVTGTKVKILNTGNYITTTNYYDNRYRLLQSISTSDWDDGAQPDFTLTETVSTDYDFTGKVLALRQKQVIMDGEQTISSEAVNKYYTYDHMGRLTRTEQQVEGDNNGKVTIAELGYNAIGELKTKSLHAEEISRGQVLDYKYNIRGWLTSVNDPDDLGTDNMFGMTLLYNDVSSLSALTGSQEQYNGNIAGMIWNRPDTTSGTHFLKSAYSFEYDGLNRFNLAYYGEGETIVSSDKFREYDMDYDLNGNITGLMRTDSLGSVIDNLSYEYASSGLSNRLINIVDDSYDADGFSDISNATDYTYDNNGNMVSDLNKGIFEISYNFLNLPDTIVNSTGDTVIYYYDAMGTKLRQIVIDSDTTGRYYFNGFEYNDTLVLDIIHNEEGYVSRSTEDYQYNYYLRDHLGNVRVVFTPASTRAEKLIQATDYYPFGMKYSTQVYVSGENKYLFNGKELQDEMGWDVYAYGARYYDPVIGRFHTIDPLAQDYSFQSPFLYAGNNPIRYIDLFGMGPEDRVFYALHRAEVDTRTYKQVLGSDAYKDKYVDCSEFAREVALTDGYDPGRSTWHQRKYYQEKGEWSTDVKNVRKGDFMFWKGTDKDGNTFYHTGVATDIDEDGNISVAQSTRNGGGKSIHNKYSTNSSGTLWAGSDYEMEFVGVGRAKGDTYKSESTISVNVVTDGGSTKKQVKTDDLARVLSSLIEELSNDLKE